MWGLMIDCDDFEFSLFFIGFLLCMVVVCCVYNVILIVLLVGYKVNVVLMCVSVEVDV